MENQFKLRISRVFRSSFTSCRSKNISDEIEKPIFLPEENTRHHHHRQLIDLFSPKPRSFPKKPLLLPATTSQNITTLATPEGQKCPPASPISPLINTYYNQYLQDDHATTAKKTSSKSKPPPPPRGEKKKTKKTNNHVNRRVRQRSRSNFLLDEFPACSYNGLFSSDEDDDDENDDDSRATSMFSSRSLSSDSSESFKIRNRKIKKNGPAGSGHSGGRNPLTSVPELMKGLKVKDSFAVVKRSSDPYSDFRTSMVEMIVERQMFTGKELENLLQCFLSLNSYHHHRVIIEVFKEIWEALLSNTSS